MHELVYGWLNKMYPKPSRWEKQGYKRTPLHAYHHHTVLTPTQKTAAATKSAGT